MLTIFVVSDATGETAERMVRSALVQFKDTPASVIRRGHVRTPKRVIAVVKESSKVSRIFRRFHAHGLIAKIARTHRC
jgi:regulator of PEP synthase PpsR (kinase-PPPase family)